MTIHDCTTDHDDTEMPPDLAAVAAEWDAAVYAARTAALGLPTTEAEARARGLPVYDSEPRCLVCGRPTLNRIGGRAYCLECAPRPLWRWEGTAAALRQMLDDRDVA